MDDRKSPDIQDLKKKHKTRVRTFNQAARTSAFAKISIPARPGVYVLTLLWGKQLILELMITYKKSPLILRKTNPPCFSIFSSGHIFPFWGIN